MASRNPGKGEEIPSPLKKSSFLSREEVLRRRSRQAKALYKVYKDQYWALVEEIRVKHREYYWDYATSPLEKENRIEEGNEESEIRVRSKCGFGGCKSKAMTFTRFCHLHILADNKQKLYKACIFNTRSGQNGPCAKPTLRAAVPSLCPAHFQKAQKHLSQSLKKVGINLCSSSRPTAQFNVILAEYIHKIQVERKKCLDKNSQVLNYTVDGMIHEGKNAD